MVVICKHKCAAFSHYWLQQACILLATFIWETWKEISILSVWLWYVINCLLYIAALTEVNRPVDLIDLLVSKQGSVSLAAFQLQSCWQLDLAGCIDPSLAPQHPPAQSGCSPQAAASGLESISLFSYDSSLEPSFLLHCDTLSLCSWWMYNLLLKIQGFYFRKITILIWISHT